MLPSKTKLTKWWPWEDNIGSGRRIIPQSSSPSRLTLFVSTFLLMILIFCFFNPNSSPPTTTTIIAATTTNNNRCAGRYIYIHRLPSRFNTDLLSNCSSINQYVNMCKYISNSGLGPPLTNDNTTIFSSTVTSWYWTNQFSLELIFHERMKRYDCLTDDSSKASAVFVPYYAGLDASHYLWNPNFTLRDSGPIALAEWLRSSPEWSISGGRDHFLVAGRTAADFCRYTDYPGAWGNKLMLLPVSSNMTFLTIELAVAAATQFAVPYPTWFHPRSAAEIASWQDFLHRKHRPHLFSFAGAPRQFINGSIRGELIDQCRSSSYCGLQLCEYGTEKCDSPEKLMSHFQKSTFCLQPPGDTLTRRSTFDGMLAGCIPVFFHRGSAYDQYRWHLPAPEEKEGRRTSYSVFIDMKKVKSGEVSVEERLRSIGREKVEAMREAVIRLIPRLVYADPTAVEKKGFEDAFDVAVRGVLDSIRSYTNIPNYN